jgi:hypothetical protein
MTLDSIASEYSIIHVIRTCELHCIADVVNWPAEKHAGGRWNRPTRAHVQPRRHCQILAGRRLGSLMVVLLLGLCLVCETHPPSLRQLMFGRANNPIVQMP